MKEKIPGGSVVEILNKTIEQVRKQYGVAGGILIAIISFVARNVKHKL